MDSVWSFAQENALRLSIGGAVLGLSLFVRRLLRYPQGVTSSSLASAERTSFEKASSKATKKGKPFSKDTVYLHQFPRGRSLGMANASSPCLKLETFLRLAGVKFEIRHANVDEGPKRKLPFVVYDGEAKGDSEMVMNWLTHNKKCAPDMDKALSPSEKAESLAFARLCDDSQYWVTVYTRWVLQPQEYVPALFAGVPKLIPLLLGPKIARDLFSAMSGTNLGRHSTEQVLDIGIANLRAIEARLQKHSSDGAAYFHGGDAPSTIDAVVFSCVVQWTAKNQFNNTVCDFARKSKVLNAYVDMIIQKHWPDYYESFQKKK